MNSRKLQIRILLVAIVPVVLASALVAYLVGSGRARDLEQAHMAQVSVLSRQLAITSQYGLYSGNRPYLESAAASLASQTSVVGVALFDADGQPMAGKGELYTRSLAQIRQPDYALQAAAQSRNVVVRPIYSSNVDIADIYSATQSEASEKPQLLGYGVLEVSRAALEEQTRLSQAYSALIAAVGALLGALLALRLSRLVLEPIRLLSENIRRIGAGDFETAIPDDHDPLQEVHTQVALMAQRLAWRRQDLEQQIHAATDALRVQRDEAEKANRAKSHFLASASHDLRQPTHAIGLFVASLKQLPLDPKAQLLAGYLQQSVHSMQDLLDGLLDLSRLDSGTVRVEARPFSVDSLFAALRATMGPADIKSGVRLRVRPTPYWAYTDPALLQQVLINLVQNALRYTDQGTVLICCRPVRDSTALRIEVRDSGIGIAEEQQEIIFQEFYQVHNPARDRGKGMGLGLSIVDRMVRLMHHTLDLRSAPGCGSTFAVEVPRCERMVALPHQESVAEDVQDAGLQAGRVLVLEDDQLVRDGITSLLKSWSYEVDAVTTPALAREHVQQHGAPDLLICDFRLGDPMNGLEAIDDLRALAGRAFPACLMSGDTDAELMRQASDHQIPLLHKPIRPAKLRSLLRRVLVPPQDAR